MPRRFMFSYTNLDVDTLNVELRQDRRDRRELAGPDVRLKTKHGPTAFAVGERQQPRSNEVGSRQMRHIGKSDSSVIWQRQ